MDLPPPSSAVSSSPPSHALPLASNHDRPSSSASHLELPSSSSVIDSDPLTQGSELERHPRGKRKRTAAKDKAILEAAYAANPKPDKAARLAIVNRVSLNEKEVQIWFQNRRQNDRRKSRPLSPQEIAALRYGGMQILSSDPPTFNSSFSSDNSDTSPAANSMSRLEPGVASPPHSDPRSSGSFDEVEKTPDVSREPRRCEDTELRERHHEMVTPAAKAEHKENALEASQSQSSSVGYVSNRWNAASSLPTPSTLGRAENSFTLESLPQPNCASSTPSKYVLPAPQSKSRFRLSLSLEGKAEVIPSDPTPPRATLPPPSSEDLQSLGPVRRLSLHRSHSTSAITLPPISVLTNSLRAQGGVGLPPRLTRGRSRDVLAWESCCDTENREDLLTLQAKHESNGSAIAAITLLRSSSSSGSPLQPSNSGKRNAPSSRVAPRPGLAKKPKLSRAMSSAAKLQSSFSVNEKTGQQRNPEKPRILIKQSGHDSDKENWSPDEEGNPRFTFSQPTADPAPRRRPLPWSPKRQHPRRTSARNSPEPYRTVLGSRSNTAPAVYPHARRGGGGKRDQSSPKLEIYEDSVGARDDDEVERFMRGEVSPSKKGDVDAVAGLLSLSQGNWR
ncbi:pah4 homeobox protein encoded by the pah4 protein [Echria macrotheca]|uniref:Pah4 homeobox protein encoded by the pah4 protein n=1 Tax=Echria macrotheca TaxID=438768 RepID=A0AAJ0BBB4_9PEZI|nr:pah4 homeobox protein encoded by the pah4 protein [Echria macrotheca]